MPKINKTSVAVGLALSAAGLVVLSSWPAEAQQSRRERSYSYSQQAPSSYVARQQNGSNGNSVYWNGCCGPNSIKLGTDPDPNIRSQLAREATRFFGGGEP
jgi:hypothetical protein